MIVQTNGNIPAFIFFHFGFRALDSINDILQKIEEPHKLENFHKSFYNLDNKKQWRKHFCLSKITTLDLQFVKTNQITIEILMTIIKFSFFLQGIIRTALPNMNRENREQYQVVIQAKDMGGPDGSLSGTTTVNITLTDVNDNPRAF